ncbi:MAG: hypothetical protein OXO48_02220 [Caldilineaceae bacterium]|nr:hypothetical protein [Caldilineaceae bacterium]
MIETETSEVPGECASPTRRSDSIRLAQLVWGTVFILTMAVVILRFYRLGDIPPGALHDEGIHGVNAMQVLRGEYAVFFPKKDAGHEGLMAYAVALTTKLLGRNVLALRLPAAVASSGCIFAVFGLGWLLFRETEPGGRPTPWRGAFVAGVGASLLAFSLGYMIIGRTAFRANLLPLFLSVVLALLWWGWRKRSMWSIALAAACAGLLHYTYLAAHFVPILLLLFGLSFLPVFRSEVTKQAGERFLSGQIVRICLFVGVASLVAAPILTYMALNPDEFFSRTSKVFVFHSSRSLGEAIGILFLNIGGHLLAFGFLGDSYWWQNLPGRPLLNAAEAIIFWLGVVTAIMRWRHPVYRLLLLWLVVLLLPAMLSRDNVPHTLRMIGAAPAVYLLAASGAWETLDFLKAQLKRRGASWAAGSVVAMVPLLLLIKGWSTHRLYFQEWAPARQIYEAYEAEWTDLTQALNELPYEAGTIYLIPDGQRQQPLKRDFRTHTFDYLFEGETATFLFHTAMPNFEQVIETRLASVQNLSMVKVVEWDLEAVWTGDEQERIDFLLGKYGRYVKTADFGSFLVHWYTDISLDSPWIPYDKLEPLTVVYDGGIELLGVALGQGLNQLSLDAPIRLGKEKKLWTVLRWQTTTELSVDYSVSLRLKDANGSDFYSKDLILWKPDHTVTGHGGPAEQFETWMNLDLPSDLLPGDYDLILVVYDSNTLKPTVEMSVWKPERFLARLQVGAGQ